MKKDIMVRRGIVFTIDERTIYDTDTNNKIYNVETIQSKWVIISDIQQIDDIVYQEKLSPTCSTYTRKTMKLFYWCICVQGDAVNTVKPFTEEDIINYIRLQNKEE